MPKPLVIKTEHNLIPLTLIKRVEIVDLEESHVVVVTLDNEQYHAYGFDAIEACMILKPSALEGRRLKWKKNAWAFHNIMGHPLMQVLAWFRCYKTAIWLHDVTTPRPRQIS